MQNHGSRANESGKNLESIIACMLSILKAKGYFPVSQYEFDIKTEYNDKFVVDFLVRGIPGYEEGLIFSCKRQEVNGSVDRKIESEIRVIKEFHPYPTIIIMVGDGWKPALKLWVEKQIGGNFIKVFFEYGDVLKWVEKIPEFDRETAGIIYEDLPMFEPKSNGVSEYNENPTQEDWSDHPLFNWQGPRKEDN